MKTLPRHLADYLEARAALGFKTDRAAWLLSSFVAFLARKRSARITAAYALSWAKQPAQAHPGWWAERLSAVRVFARHVHLVDPRHEIPSVELLCARIPRATPVLYSPQELRRLLRATAQMRAPFKALTHDAVFGLLAATGMRVGEALRLDRCDVDLRDGVLSIRDTKFHKSREVLLHSTTVRVLRRYDRARDLLHRKRVSPSFFVSLSGTRLIYNNVHQAFALALRRAGLRRERARLHDLRHSFAVSTLLRWHRAGLDVDAHMPLLSTYLGHRNPSSTYWYLSAAPELMALAGRKLQRALGALP